MKINLEDVKSSLKMQSVTGFGSYNRTYSERLNQIEERLGIIEAALGIETKDEGVLSHVSILRSQMRLVLDWMKLDFIEAKTEPEDSILRRRKAKKKKEQKNLYRKGERNE